MSLLRIDVVEYAGAGGRSRYRLGWVEAVILALAAAVWTMALIAAPVPPHRAGGGASAGFIRSFGALAVARGGEAGGLLTGLVFGDVSGVGPELAEAMRAASLSHLTAVSGANCVVWAAAVGVALRSRHVGWRGRLLAQIAAVWGFAVSVGGPETVLRAATMLTVAAGIRLLGRATHPAVSLAWAVTALIVAHPPIVHSLSFQLSVAATAGILALSDWIEMGLARWVGGRIAGVVAVTVAAQVGCLPLLLPLGQTPSLAAVLANVLAGVAVPVATLAGILALPVLWCPPLAAAVLTPGLAAAAWIAAVARFFVAHQVGRIPWPAGGAGVLVAAVVAAGLIAAPQLGRSRRRWVLAPVVVITALSSGLAAAGEVRSRLAFPLRPAIVQCDVGQGDALLLIDPAAVMMIDTGPDPGRADACLQLAGVRRVDVLVLTHFDADHVGGAAGLSRRGRSVGEVLLSGAGDPKLATVLGRIRPESVRVVREGETGAAGGIAWRALWPRQPPAGAVENGNSLVVRAEAQGVSVLALGDLGAAEQRRLLPEVAPVDVLKVAHHGSADEEPALIRAARPRVALISVGADNPYGHPTGTLLRSLAGVAYARTDQDGAVAVGAAPAMAIWCEHRCRHVPVE